MKKKPEEPDNLEQDIEKVLKKIDYITESDKQAGKEAIFKKIRADKYLNSMCMRLPDYLHCLVFAMASFGTEVVNASTRTQILVWYTLERLRRFWILAEEPVPLAEDICKHVPTMDFLKEVAKLCYKVSNTEQIVVTGVIDKGRI